MRVYMLLLICCVYFLACQEAQKPSITKKKETKPDASAQKKQLLDIQVILPKFKYKDVKHFTTRPDGYGEVQDLPNMGLEKIDSTLLKILGLLPNMELYYYAYGRLHNNTYLMAFLG